ncbi:MAG TPA: hypothetical protein VLL25_05100 [Acidimicrobiales bacterium]|nr:hypothetical protein [Acidimicrobiales bacterium]
MPRSHKTVHKLSAFAVAPVVALVFMTSTAANTGPEGATGNSQPVREGLGANAVSNAASSFPRSGGPGRPLSMIVIVPLPKALAEQIPNTLPIISQPPMGGGSKLSQKLIAPVRPGPLAVRPSRLTLTMVRLGDSNLYQGSFGPLTLTDARGTLAGWKLSVTIAGLPPGSEAKVFPQSVVGVTGYASEVRSAHRSTCESAKHCRAPIASAREGGGSGIFQLSGTVTVELFGGEPDLMSAFTVTVTPRVS